MRCVEDTTRSVEFQADLETLRAHVDASIFDRHLASSDFANVDEPVAYINDGASYWTRGCFLRGVLDAFEEAEELAELGHSRAAARMRELALDVLDALIEDDLGWILDELGVTFDAPQVLVDEENAFGFVSFQEGRPPNWEPPWKLVEPACSSQIPPLNDRVRRERPRERRARRGTRGSPSTDSDPPRHELAAQPRAEGAR